MLDTMEGACGYTEIQCIWSKSGYNEIQSWLNSMNRALDTIRYNVSGPSPDTMDTNLTSRFAARSVVGRLRPSGARSKAGPAMEDEGRPPALALQNSATATSPRSRVSDLGRCSISADFYSWLARE